MTNKSKYIAAAAQLGPINPEDSKETVISRMFNLLVEAKTQEAKLVVFPELCFTTFFPRYYITDQTKLDTFYETDIPISIMTEMFELIKEENIIISFGFAENDNGTPFNTSVYVDSSRKLLGNIERSIYRVTLNTNHSVHFNT